MESDLPAPVYDREYRHTEPDGTAWHFHEVGLVSPDRTHPTGFGRAEVRAMLASNGQATWVFPPTDWQTPAGLAQACAEARRKLQLPALVAAASAIPPSMPEAGPVNLPTNPKFVVLAALLAGGVREGGAPLADIYRAAAKQLPTWAEYYKDEASFRATIRHTIECYCPQSENYRPERQVIFERVDRGRYRVVDPEEQAPVRARGRTL